MSLVVPHPVQEMDLQHAGPNGDGEFIVVSKGSAVVRVPNESRVALAAHLLAGSGVFSPDVIRFLRATATKARKKRGGKLTADEADALDATAHSLELLMQEYLEADPGSSTRYEFRPSYYEDRVKFVRAAEPNLAPPPAHYPVDIDDTPMPWEK